MYDVSLIRRLSIPCLLIAFLFSAFVSDSRAERFPLDRSVEADWVCVTDAAFVDHFERLAAHRERGGLRSVVVSYDEVLLFSPVGTDSIESLRWFAEVAHTQWGARYLLLGGDHHVLPAPYSLYETPGEAWEYPVDMYYACLGEGWDMDGDGYVGETVDDAPDLTPHLAVGRLPVESVAEAQSVVDKTLAYETRRGDGIDRRLLNAAGFLGSESDPEGPGLTLGTDLAEGLAAILAGLDPDLEIKCLYLETPEPLCGAVLSPTTFVDALLGAHHDYVSFQCVSTDEIWACHAGLYLNPSHVASLAGLGESALFSVPYTDAARTDGEGLLETLVVMDGGGAVAGRGAAGITFVALGRLLNEAFWSTVFSGDPVRIGDAHLESIEALHALFGETTPRAILGTTTASLLGDPALWAHPLVPTDAPVVAAARIRDLRASPNPFNPLTDVSFTLDGADDSRLPVLVEVFDVRGRRAGVLLDADLAPGRHAVAWRGADEVASGLYFVRVRAAGRDAVIKVTKVE